MHRLTLPLTYIRRLPRYLRYLITSKVRILNKKVFVYEDNFHKGTRRRKLAYPSGRAEAEGQGTRLLSSISKIYNEQRCKYLPHLLARAFSMPKTCLRALAPVLPVPKQQSLAQSHQPPQRFFVARAVPCAAIARISWQTRISE